MLFIALSLFVNPSKLPIKRPMTFPRFSEPAPFWKNFFISLINFRGLNAFFYQLFDLVPADRIWFQTFLPGLSQNIRIIHHLYEPLAKNFEPVRGNPRGTK